MKKKLNLRILSTVATLFITSFPILLQGRPCMYFYGEPKLPKDLLED